MKYKFLSLAAFFLLVVTSCTQEESFEENRITRVSAELPDFIEENGTRSQINVSASDGISYSWAIGDVLGIFPDEGDQVSFRLTESSLSADGKNATFDGGAWALKNGHTYYSYFPFSYENFTESSSLAAIPVDYTGQSISSWGDTKNAGKYDFCAAGGTSSTSGALSFQFQRLGALLRVKLTLPATSTYQKLTLSTDADVIPVKGKVDLSASTIAYISQTYASEISVNLNNISGTKDQVAYVYLMLPPMTLLTQNKLLTATLFYNSGNSSSYDLCKAGNTTPHTPDFKANTIYKRDAVPQGINPGGEMSGGGEEEAGNTLNGHEYVDLGLPSGTLWATCNVGASSPEDYGDYYEWGETETKSTNDRWSTYKWYNGSSNTLTKYNTSSYLGTVDNKKVLDPEDDVAHVKWGGSWRMPTDAELTELREKCTWTWTTQNGKNGYKVTSKSNGNYIFLPAAGCRVDSSLYDAGTYGYYWSASLDESYPGYAWDMCFDSGDVGGDFNNFRFYGQSVRPVYVEPKETHEYVDLGLPSGTKWATCNVGASSPEDYGDYYAWGETETKSTYDWSTYKWCNGSSTTLTKYNTDSYWGTVDNKTVLDPEDDVAHVKWGGDWRMPTEAEQDELRAKCTWTWTTQNGKEGYKVTSKSNGKSIFLPAAGRFDISLINAGSYGAYWSSSLDNSAVRACGVKLEPSSVGWYNFGRILGLSVRPVCP